MRCLDCKYEAPATVRKLIKSNTSASLMKVQSELGAHHTFRESENIFESFCGKKRIINNRNKIKDTTNVVGDILSEKLQQESERISIPEAKEIIINVDGGHVKTVEDKQSIEAMTSVVYKPESLVINKDKSN